MQWQDWVITTGLIVFIIALVPTIKAKEKPALSTSLTTGIVLIVFAFTYFTLKLWLSTLLTALTATSWLVLAYQKYNQGKISSK